MAITIVNSKLKTGFRKERLHDRPHIVIPTTMIVPGVLNGSAGAGYYSKEENQKSVDLWNGMPVVAPEHPNDEGKFVSARSPDILNKFGVGIVLNTRNENNLTAETWLDERKTQEVDPRILWRIYNNEPVEVSTGLSAVHNKTPGEFKGSRYDWAALNYRPDHLAILTDQIGACSLADGCGLMVNQLTFDQIHTQLSLLLREQHAGSNEITYLEDVTSTYVIYMLGDQLRKQPYTKTRDELSLTGASVNVELKKSYVVVNSVVDDQSAVSNSAKGSAMNKTEMVNSIINSGCDCWGEGEREILNGFTEDHLQRMNKGLTIFDKQNKIVNTLRKGMETDEFTVTFNDDETGILVNTKTKPVTEPVQEPVQNHKITMEDLPQELQDQLAFAKSVQNREKDTIIEEIVGNSSDEKKEGLRKTLASKSFADLQFMKELIPAPVTAVSNFAGRSGGQAPKQTSESNFDNDDALTVNAFTFQEN